MKWAACLLPDQAILLTEDLKSVDDGLHFFQCIGILGLHAQKFDFHLDVMQHPWTAVPVPVKKSVEIQFFLA